VVRVVFEFIGALVREALGYLRVRRVGDEQLLRLCAARGIKLLAVYREDSDSPGLGERFCALVKRFSRVDAKILVVGERRDLATERWSQMVILCYLASKGIHIYSLADDSDISQGVVSSRRGRELVRLHREFSALDAALNMVRLVKIREKNRQVNGRCEGRKRFADKAPDAVAEIGRLRRKKIKDRSITYKEIAAAMNSKGFKTAGGREFTPNNVAVIVHRLKRQQGGVS